MMTKGHYYYMVNNSPWPTIISINSFNFFMTILMIIKKNEIILIQSSILTMIAGTLMWWMVTSKEMNTMGEMSLNSNKSLKSSMILFISSEILFFFSMFWAYFHFNLSPTVELGLTWPPMYLQMFDYLNIPMMNTLILLTSGITITLAHKMLYKKKKSKFKKMMISTMILGMIFSMLQLIEYKNSFFTMSDSSFGTVFFMLTGFHGIHVLIGTIYLTTNLMKMEKMISNKESLNFEMSAWYWHFVDVVWILVYLNLYYLNN